ncbi:MAG: DUF6133 family protein [Alkaliphilus sp.]
MKILMNKVNLKAIHILNTAKQVMASDSGEGFIDSAVKILINVVVGALLLAGIYALFADLILPTLTQKITDMFNFTN